MKSPDININLAGSVTHPPLMDAAEKELGRHLPVFLAQYGENFTAKQLVTFVEELRYGARTEHDAA